MENDWSSQLDEPRRSIPADVIVAIPLLVVHVGLALLMALVAPALAMGTDACAYQACGDEKWVVRAVYLTWAGGALAVIIDIAVTSLLLGKHRIAFWVPIVGCLLQLALGQAVLHMASLSGPIK